MRSKFIKTSAAEQVIAWFASEYTAVGLSAHPLPPKEAYVLAFLDGIGSARYVPDFAFALDDNHQATCAVPELGWRPTPELIRAQWQRFAPRMAAMFAALVADA